MIGLALDSRSHVSAGPPTFAYVFGVSGIVFSYLIIIGASHMSRLDSFDLAYWATWLALLPLGPFGWPVVLWSWWALTLPGVRSAFRSSPRRSAAAPAGTA
jgi:hypothetical protein